MDMHVINYIHVNNDVIVVFLEVLEYSNYNYMTGSAKT